MLRFLLTPPELERLPRRAQSAAFQPALARLQREADEFFAMQLAVPELPGGYYHDFICPRHGVELRFDPHRPTEHRCPVDEALFRGEKFNAAWRWFVNHHLAESALPLAVLWRTKGSAAHRETVRDILLGYAARYDFYSGCPRTGENPGIATYTTLDESVWSIPLAWAYSLIAETLSGDESDAIVSRLFVPLAEHLVRRRYRAVHNFTCWHNAAIATMGRVAGRADLVQFALDGDLGQRTQLRDGMLGDGLWFEGSMSYHFYSVWAILMSALVFRHDAATEITSDSAVPKSLLAPIECAYPDGTLPATNDCWYFTSIIGECCHGVPPAPDFYEIAFSLYGDPAFAATLQRAYGASSVSEESDEARWGSRFASQESSDRVSGGKLIGARQTIRLPAIEGSRNSFFALLLGVESLPREPPPSRVSIHLPDSGLAILRPAGDVDLMLKYGPHGGHHGHPDKLSLTGWAHGWRFSPDLGTPGYGVESLETWYRQTLSHNTVLIDGESQPPAHGRLQHFEAGCAVVAVEWDGVKLRRTVHARPEYFIDVFEVDCSTPRSIDWIYHNAGVLTGDASAQAVDSIAGGEAYQHLSGVSMQTGCGPMGLLWSEAPHFMHIWMPPVAGEQIFTGLSPANPPTTCYGFVLRRRKESWTVFVSVLHPYYDTPQVRHVEFFERGGLQVQLSDRNDKWMAEQLLL